MNIYILFTKMAEHKCISYMSTTVTNTIIKYVRVYTLYYIPEPNGSQIH